MASHTVERIDENELFLLKCMLATPIEPDFEMIAKHYATSEATEKARFDNLKRVAAAAEANREIVRAISSGPKTPVGDNYHWFMMAIDLAGVRPNMRAVARAMRMTLPQAKMKYYRLTKAISEAYANDTGSDLEQ